MSNLLAVRAGQEAAGGTQPESLTRDPSTTQSLSTLQYNMMNEIERDQ